MQFYRLKPPRKALVRLILFVGLFGAVQAAMAAGPEPDLMTRAADGVQAIPQESIEQERAPLACPANPSGYPDEIDRANFCVFYDDADTTDAQAEEVADIVQDYWDRYAALGFLPPLINSGTKLDIRIVDNAGCNGGASGSNFTVWNGCFGMDNRVESVIGHELFHMIQYNYDSNYVVFGEYEWFYEGTARMMQDKTFAVMDSLTNAAAMNSSYNNEVNNYLSNTNRDLTSDPMKYMAALWWNYFAEQYGTDPDEPELGVDAIEALWDATDPAKNIAALNLAFSNIGASDNFDSAFRKFTAANWLKDLTGASDVYDYVDEDQVGNPMPYGPIMPLSAGPINNGGAGSSWNNQNIARYGARYYRTQIGNSCSLVSVDVNTDSGPAFYHIITEESQPGDNQLGYFGTNTATSWNRSFFNDGSIDFVTVIAGSTSGSATVDVSVDCADPEIDIKLPNGGAVANAGPAAGPGKFLAQVLVTDGSEKGAVIDGLTINDFKAAVGGVEALITGSGFVQEQYWLVIQAPTQAADGLYSLEVRLEESGTANVIAMDTNDASVNYTPDNVDHLLIIDRSGSMSSDGKFVAAQNAANFYIDITRNSDGLAVIPFSDDQTPGAFNLTEVTTVPNVRGNAENYVDGLSIGNLTSIGDGLDEAVDQRNTTPTSNPLCSFVLMSDGMETASQYWTDVDTDVIATGCPVTTIAFGSAADETLMQDIATATGGAFYYNDVFVSTSRSAAANSIADTNLGLGNTYEYAQAESEGRVRLLQERGEVPIFQSEFELPPDQIHKVFIDETVGEVVFSLDWYSINAPDCDNPQVSNGCFGKDLELKLVQPDGNIITKDNLPYTFEDVVSGHLGWRIEKPMEGEWTLVVNADSEYVWYDIPYQVIVSGPSYLTAELLLADKTGIRNFTGDQVPIHAFVSSNKPLAGASVVAEVTSPDGQLTPVVLYDDGQHGDGEPNDGFYAGMFTRVNQAEAIGPQGEDGGKVDKRVPDEGSYQVRLLVRLNDIIREALGSFSVAEAPDENQNGIPDPYEQANGIKLASADVD
ncbi:MAG: choice-of-anchor X domain-containing protein, partial [Chloroflexota bacterium]